MTADILIVGSGALATYFAGRLSSAGVEVMMLGTWTEGLAALRHRGAHLDGLGNYGVQVSESPADCQGLKYALVLVKSWQTERAGYQLADCLSEDGLVVTLQNGLGNDEILSRFLGPERVARGVTTIGAALLGPGFVRSSGKGEVTIETHAGLTQLVELLRVAEFEVNVVQDAQPFVWGKLMINAAINPLTALLRVKNGELLDNPQVRVLIKDLTREAALVAEMSGVVLPYPFPECAVEDVARDTSDNISSMLQDVLRGAPTEVDAINGAIVMRGEQKGIPTPVNRAAWLLVRVLVHFGKI
jgi:2-dehydropantoate 2-reductase